MQIEKLQFVFVFVKLKQCQLDHVTTKIHTVMLYRVFTMRYLWILQIARILWIMWSLLNKRSSQVKGKLWTGNIVTKNNIKCKINFGLRRFMDWKVFTQKFEYSRTLTLPGPKLIVRHNEPRQNRKMRLFSRVQSDEQTSADLSY